MHTGVESNHSLTGDIIESGTSSSGNAPMAPPPSMDLMDYNDRHSSQNNAGMMPNKRTKYSQERDSSSSSSIVFEDDLDDGYGPDLIGDDNDRLYLNSLPELDREQILMERHERRQELQRKINRLKREGRLRERTTPVQQASLPESVGGYGVRNSSLNDLRQRRIEQKNKRKKQEEILQNELQKRQQQFNQQTSELPSSLSSTPQSQDPQALKKEIFLPTIQDILHITVSRTAIEAWIQQPFFEELIKNCFVKFLVGTHNGSKVYKLVEIIELEDCEPYPLGTSGACSKMMRVALGDHQEISTLDKVSNQPITHAEFDFWFRTNYNSKSPETHIPTPDQIMKKAKKLQEAHDDFQAQMQRLKQLNRKYTMDDSLATLSKAAAELRIDLEQMEGSNPQKAKKESQLSEVQALIEVKKQNMQPTQRLRKINDKILRRNMEQKSQVRLLQKKKTKENLRSVDPFSRIDSSHSATSSMFGARSNADDSPSNSMPAEEEVVEKKKPIQAKDIADAHDFDLDIEI